MRQLITEQYLAHEMALGAKPAQLKEQILESLDSGELKPEQVSIRGLWNKLVYDKTTGEPVGFKLLEKFEEGASLGRWLKEEGASSVQSADFAQISAQLYYHKILQTYQLYSYPLTKLFEVVQSNILTSPERMAGIGDPGPGASDIGEGQEIPDLDLKADYIDTPPMLKKGRKIRLSREALVQDRTGLMMQQAKAIGINLAHIREYEAACTLAELPYTITDAGGNNYTINPNRATGQRNSYYWKDNQFVNYSTAASGQTDWVNKKTNNALQDQEQINQASIVLDSILSPFSGFPLATPEKAPDLVCTQDLYYKAKKIQHSTWYRSGSSSNFGTMQVPGDVQYFDAPFTLHKSKHLKQVLSANSVDAGTFFFGHIGEAFGWRRYLQMEVQEMLPNAGMAWSHDVVMGFRVLDFQTAFTLNPRYVVYNATS